MRSRDETPGSAARPGRRLTATVLFGAFVALPIAGASCGQDAASTPPSSPAARVAAPSSPSGAGAKPTAVTGAVCDASATGAKPLPAPARATIERFVAAVDQGDRVAMRALLAPGVDDEVLAGLGPVSRLRLLELEDRY